MNIKNEKDKSLFILIIFLKELFSQPQFFQININ